MKALISCAVTAQLICGFLFAYAKSRFSHNEAQLFKYKYYRSRIARKSVYVVYTRFATLLTGKAWFTSALRQPCTYLRRQISWFRTAASRCCEQHRKTAVRKTRSHGCRNEFSDMFIFFAICLRFLRDVRQPQDTLGCHKTAARHSRCS